MVELDHLFVCAPVGAPEADQLLHAGFREGRPNVHPRQGTACRRFFFRNAYLEFLWVHDESEARSESVAPTRLWDRCRYRQTGHSPFGIGLRPGPEGPAHVRFPFETWAYRPAYLPPPLQIDVAENRAFPAEPFLFYMGAGVRPDEYAAGREQPLEHGSGARHVTGVTITLPVMRLSAALEAVEQCGLVRFVLGREHMMEVSFDGEERGEVGDYRPGIPLVLRW